MHGMEWMQAARLEHQHVGSNFLIYRETCVLQCRTSVSTLASNEESRTARQMVTATPGNMLCAPRYNPQMTELSAEPKGQLAVATKTIAA